MEQFDEEEYKNINTIKPFKYRQYLAAFIVNILSICNGFSAAWSSPVQKLLQTEDNPVGKDPLSNELYSWITSIMYIGGLVGIFIWRPIADKFGRKINGYLLCLSQMLGWLGIILARHPSHLIISRFIIGLGGCGIMSNGQLYISETTDTQIKGPLCSLILICMNAGIIITSVLGSLLSYEALNICCFSFPVIFLLLYFWLPETPFYLFTKNRLNEAKQSREWFGLEEIGLSCYSNERCGEPSYEELFATQKMRRITFVAMGLFFCQQMSGIGAILAYSVDIFALFESSVSPHVSSIILSCIQLVISAISGFVIKSNPRKPLLLYSYIGAFLSYFLIFVYFCIKEYTSHYVFKLLPIFGVLFYVVMYNLSIGSLPFVILAEIFPARVLNRGISLALIVLVLAAFTTTNVFPIIKDILGESGLYLLFSCLNLSFGLFVLKFLWETKPRDDKETKSASVN